MCIELEAFNNFVKRFKQDHLFEFRKLKDAVAISRITNGPLLLCISDNSSNLFNSCLLQSVLYTSYANHVLWDVADGSLIQPLINVYNQHLNCPNVANAMSAGGSSIFLIEFTADTEVARRYLDLEQLVDETFNIIPNVKRWNDFKHTLSAVKVHEDLGQAIESAFTQEIPLLLKDYNVNGVFGNYSLYCCDVSDAPSAEFNKWSALGNALKHLEAGSSGLFVFNTTKAKLELHTFFSENIPDDAQFVFELNNIGMDILRDYEAERRICEEVGVARFVRAFEKDYGLDHPEFLNAHLGNVINDCVSVEPKYLQRCLVLYLHDDDSPFSRRFAPMLVNGELRDHLNHFKFVGWEIGRDVMIRNAQLKILARCFDVEVINKALETRQSGVYFFMPMDGKPRLFSFIGDVVEFENVMFSILQIENALAGANGITDFAELRACKRANIPSICPSLQTSLVNLLQEKFLKCRSIEERKMLLLYFYKKGSVVSKNFEILLKSSMEHRLLVNSKFHFLAWDVSGQDDKELLKIALKRQFNDKKMVEFLDNEIPGLFVFTPIADCLTLSDYIPYDASCRNISNALEKSSKNFATEMEIETELQNNDRIDSGGELKKPEMLQQVIYDQLGNRDYDCFELEKPEHPDYLFRKVAFAYFGPPSDTGEAGGYDETQARTVEKTIIAIKNESRKYTGNDNLVVFTTIYNLTTPFPAAKLEKMQNDKEYHPARDYSSMPVFVVPKCRQVDADLACRTYIDSELRVYASWEAYLNDNQLGECLCVTPKDGRYQGDSWGRVLLEYTPSPACKMGSQVLRASDVASIAVGLTAGIAGGIALLPVAAVAAPVVLPIAAGTGIAASIYTLTRSVYNIYDRSVHNQTLSFANREARGAYFNIATAALGFSGIGARIALTTFISNGGQAGMVIRGAVNGLTGANVLVSGAAIGNSTYDVVSQWITENEQPTPLTVLQLTSSILFFGHSVYNLQSASSVINETQAQQLENIKESLRSNRHRKTFDKLTKETVRKLGEQRGRAQVIAYVKNLGSSKDDVLATLTRNNKMLNKKGIRFSVVENQIEFNHIKVDLTSLSGADAVSQFNPDLAGLSSNNSCMVTSSTGIELSCKFSVGFEIATKLLPPAAKLIMESESIKTAIKKMIWMFSDFVQERLYMMLATLLGNSMLNKCLLDFFPQAQIPLKVLQFLMNYFKTRALEYMKERGESEYEHGCKIIRYMEMAFVFASMNLALVINKLIKYISIQLVDIMLTCADTTLSDSSDCNAQTTATTNTCLKCSGLYYSL